MNRIVLAILALFAGLAAQVAPAQARLDAATQVGAAASASTAVRSVAAAELAVFRAESVPSRALPARAGALPQPLRLAAAAVLIGIDRARE